MKPPEIAPELATSHRKRMRQKVLTSGAASLSDLEVLEMALYSAMPRSDNKPVIKALLKRFKTIGAVVNASESDLQDIPKVGETVIANLHILAEISIRIAKAAVKNKSIFDNWPAVEQFCITKLAHIQVEMFLVLFLLHTL